MTTEYYQALAAIADRFDCWILDLWGVLHDGVKPYPGAIETLKKLRAKNKKIILLSNAPRQSHKAEAVLSELGFDRKLYDYVITSGQMTHDYLATRIQDLGFSVDRKSKPYSLNPIPYFYIGPQKDADLIADLKQYRMVNEVHEAEFALVTGFDAPGMPFASKKPQIDAALAAGLTLVCANPDRQVVRQDGSVWLCSGLVAEYYRERGGKVIEFGKPYREVYDQCFALFKSTERRARSVDFKVCAVGDSLHTDIAGAKTAGIVGILCAGGMLKEELGISFGQLPEEQALKKLCAREGVTPDIVLPAFIW